MTDTNEIEETTSAQSDEIKESGPRTAVKVTGVRKDAKLKVVVEENPKRPGSSAYERFEGYFKLKEGSTVQDALDHGLTMGDIKYDIAHNYIEVEDASTEEYEVKPRGPRGSKPKDPDLEGDEASLESISGDVDEILEDDSPFGD